MLAAVDLDDQPRSSRQEIDNIGADRNLAAKFHAAEPTVAQMPPQPPFGIGRLKPQHTSPFQGHRLKMHPLTLPSPPFHGGEGRKRSRVPAPCTSSRRGRGLPLLARKERSLHSVPPWAALRPLPCLCQVDHGRIFKLGPTGALAPLLLPPPARVGVRFEGEGRVGVEVATRSMGEAAQPPAPAAALTAMPNSPR